MNDKELDTKSRILQFAIDMVGSRGEVTIRELAEAAGVNVASINYYFGSKENLMKEVEKHYSFTLYNFQYNIFTSNELSPHDKLLEWAKSMSAFIYQYPALISLIVKLSVEDTDYTPVLVEKIYLNEELQNMMQQTIGEIIRSDDKKLLKLKYLQLFSGILGPVINRLVEENFSDKPPTLNFSSKADLEEYMKLLIDTVLA
ncbi:MAG: TetR/AcrR family transcriptional regulator [Clostridiales bacterium]|nr:TetR/AcrR family transcriptional regulator [Clostridiales bacterium]